MALNSRNTASVNSAFSSNAADPPLPPPPQLTIRSPSPAADIPSSPSIVSSPVPHDIPSEEAEYALDEATLRDIYADEEIDRFLHLFNAVRITSASPHNEMLTLLSAVCNGGP